MAYVDAMWQVFTNFIEFFILAALLALFALFIHDKYVQRKRALLINYPVIGRMRYIFEMLREPLRQYFTDEKKRASYLVYKQSEKIRNYHNNLIKSMQVVLAVMGIKSIKELDKSHLTFKNRNGEVFFDIDLYFRQKLHL